MFAEAGAPPVEFAARNGGRARSLHLRNPTSEANVGTTDRKKDQPPPAVISADPDPELEKRLRLKPDDLDAKVDVGSDESMDASDPPSVVRPGNTDPVPSSGSPEECGKDGR